MKGSDFFQKAPKSRYERGSMPPTMPYHRRSALGAHVCMDGIREAPDNFKQCGICEKEKGKRQVKYVRS
jgi:hypothetical protein